jgi:hypothetical protein
VSALKEPEGKVTLAPPGKDTVPPSDTPIGRVALAITPAIKTENVPDLLESAELVAERFTI